MTRWSIVLSAALALSAACVGMSGAERPRLGLASALEIPRTPAIPKMINLDTYAWGTPLFPRGTEAAYAVVLPHPRDRARFQIYGFDPRRGVALFHGEGDIARTLSATREQINRDLTALRSSGAPNIAWSIAGQEDAGPVGPPPIGPVIHQRARAAAYKTYMAEQEMMAYGGE